MAVSATGGHMIKIPWYRRRDDFRYLASRAGWIIDRSRSLARLFIIWRCLALVCGARPYLVYEAYVITVVASRSEI